MLVKVLKNYWAALLWAAFILLICGVPQENLPNVDFWAINIEDKLAHIGVFAILGLFMAMGHFKFHGSFKLNIRTVITMICVGTLYGVFTEVMQDQVFVSRYASFGDLVADAIGSVFGTVFAFFYLKNKRPR